MTMPPRLRRLQADYAQLTAAFAGHPAVRVEPLGPMPPERYRILYAVAGLRLGPDRQVWRAYQHVIDIYLPAGYPREKPYAVSAVEVFHPNFGAHVCIADFWSPSQSLVDVVSQIGDMLQYKLYNVRSPLNAVAAKWAMENQYQLPVGDVSVLPIEPEIILSVT